jgi:hypothetical protein
VFVADVVVLVLDEIVSDEEMVEVLEFEVAVEFEKEMVIVMLVLIVVLGVELVFVLVP